MTDQVGTCSFCGDALLEESRFCPTCGREVAHALQSAHVLAPAHRHLIAPEPEPKPEPALANLPAGIALGLAGLVLAAGALMPWVANSLGDTLNGLHYAGAAVPLLVCGACLAALGIWGAAKSGGRRLFAIGMTLSAVAVAISVLYLAGTHYYLGHQVSEYLPVLNREFVRLETGPYVVAAGAVLGVAASLYGMHVKVSLRGT